MLKNHTRPWSTCRLPDGSGHRWHTPLHQQLLGETASQALFSPSRSVWFHFFPSGTCIFSKVDVNHFASPVMYHLIEAMNCCMTEAECTCICTHTYTRTHTHRFHRYHHVHRITMYEICLYTVDMLCFLCQLSERRVLLVLGSVPCDATLQKPV